MKEYTTSDVSRHGSPYQTGYAFTSRHGSYNSIRNRSSRNFSCASEIQSLCDAGLQSSSKIGLETQELAAPIKKYGHVKSRYMDFLRKGIDRDIVKGPSMDWKDYHRLSVIHEFMDNLDDSFPSICSTGVIGSSLEGRDLKVLKISNSEASNAAVWMDAGIHAREWIAPAVATYIANHIANNFKDMPAYVTNKDWYILPVMNPDGYEWSHTNTRLWRKNRAWHSGRCFGVDLNRNFSYGWGGRGSSDDPSSPFYRGPEPFSEPESCAVRDMIIDSGIDFKVYITLHSYGQVILFPYACKDELCKDYIRLLEGATAMSKNIYSASRNTYKVGVSRDIMYGASGTSNDWSYGEANVPFCYLIELRSKAHKFKVPQEEIEETGNEILHGVLGLMEHVDNYFRQKQPKFKKRPSFLRTQVWEVKFTCDGQRQFVRQLDTSGAVNIWKEEPTTMDIMVEGPYAASVAGMLHERDIPFTVAISDVEAMTHYERTCIGAGHSHSSRGGSTACACMDWKQYHRLETIYTFLDQLCSECPYLCSVHCIGYGCEGREIKMLKISNGNPQNEAVWIDGAMHAREWISTAVVTYVADNLVHKFNRLPDTITCKDWYIVPVLNPDGYEYTHTIDRMWRKNRSRYGECIGVDLNRNFSFGWGEKGEEGSSEDPGNIFFRGPQPFSEPESCAVRRTILECDADFKVFLSFHSYGEVIIFPWGYTGDPCPDYVELLEAGTAMAKAIYAKSGHTYKVGSTRDLMYYAAGTSIDWSYGVANIPYSYMVELRGKRHRFLLPKEEIISTGEEVWSGVLTLIDFIDAPPCKGTQHCPP